MLFQSFFLQFHFLLLEVDIIKVVMKTQGITKGSELLLLFAF